MEHEDSQGEQTLEDHEPGTQNPFKTISQPLTQAQKADMYIRHDSPR